MLEIMRQLHLAVHNLFGPEGSPDTPPHFWVCGGGSYAPASAPFHRRPLPAIPPQTSSSPTLTLFPFPLHLSLDQSGLPINFHSLSSLVAKWHPPPRRKKQPSEWGSGLSPKMFGNGKWP